MKKHSKKTALIIAIICILALAGGTAAYYTVTSDVSKSTVAASNLKIDLIMLEEDDQGNRSQVKGTTPIVPGEKKSRIALVRNTGKESAWVRVKADLEMDGETMPAMETPYTQLDGLDDGTNWTWSEGYWYYNKPLEPGQTTSQLFTGISFRADSVDESNGEKINLKVDAEGTQTKHNGKTAIKAKGWPAE